MREIVLIAHNVRSTHNVGSLLRTAEGLGVQWMILTGYSPYPQKDKDERLPHLSQKITNQISKTSLGAELSLPWQQTPDIYEALQDLRDEGYTIVAIEQAKTSIPLPKFKPESKIALLVGREVEGIEPEILALCDSIVEIPMFGKKESFNVVQAAAMALYHCRFTTL